MKKLSVLFLTAICAMPAIAEPMYGTSDEYDYVDEEIAPLSATTPSVGYSAPAPASTSPRGARDNYVGFRVHQNAHLAMKYDVNHGYTTHKTKKNMGLSLNVGNRLTEYVKIEFETGYTGAKFTKRDTHHDYDLWSNMLNVYMYKNFGGAVEPYAGLGVGMTGIWGEISGAAPHITASTLDLSVQGMFGVNFALNDRIDLNLGAKYIRYGRVEFERNNGEYANTRIDATEFFIGAAYKFDVK
mgnify:FL=1